MTTKQKAKQLALTLVGEDQNPKPLVEVLMEMANWQKEQIMKKAFTVELAKPLKPAGQTHLCGSFACGNSGDKVKIIIVKED